MKHDVHSRNEFVINLQNRQVHGEIINATLDKHRRRRLADDQTYEKQGDGVIFSASNCGKEGKGNSCINHRDDNRKGCKPYGPGCDEG